MTYKVVVTYQDKTQDTFKCKTNPTKDTIYQLPFTLFERFSSVLDKRDWAQSTERIKHFLSKSNVKVVSWLADGRKKETKALRWFSWSEVFSQMELIEYRQTPEAKPK